MDNLTWAVLCEKISELIAENDTFKSGDFWYNECQRLMAENEKLTQKIEGLQGANEALEMTLSVARK